MIFYNESQKQLKVYVLLLVEYQFLYQSKQSLQKAPRRVTRLKKVNQLHLGKYAGFIFITFLHGNKIKLTKTRCLEKRLWAQLHIGVGRTVLLRQCRRHQVCSVHMLSPMLEWAFQGVSAFESFLLLSNLSPIFLSVTPIKAHWFIYLTLVQLLLFLWFFLSSFSGVRR